MLEARDEDVPDDPAELRDEAVSLSRGPRSSQRLTWGHSSFANPDVSIGCGRGSRVIVDRLQPGGIPELDTQPWDRRRCACITGLIYGRVAERTRSARDRIRKGERSNLPAGAQRLPKAGRPERSYPALRGRKTNSNSTSPKSRSAAVRTCASAFLSRWPRPDRARDDGGRAKLGSSDRRSAHAFEDHAQVPAAAVKVEMRARA